MSRRSRRCTTQMTWSVASYPRYCERPVLLRHDHRRRPGRSHREHGLRRRQPATLQRATRPACRRATTSGAHGRRRHVAGDLPGQQLHGRPPHRRPRHRVRHQREPEPRLRRQRRRHLELRRPGRLLEEPEHEHRDHAVPGPGAHRREHGPRSGRHAGQRHEPPELRAGGVPAPAWFHTDFGDGGQAVIDQGNADRMFHTYFNQSFNFYGPARTFPTAGLPGSWPFAGCYFGYGPQYYNGLGDCTDPVSFYAPLTSNPSFSPDVIYFGTDRVYRSPSPQPTVFGLTSWTAVSPALTTGALRLRDRRLQRTSSPARKSSTRAALSARSPSRSTCHRRAAGTWTDISAGLPPRFVSEIEVDSSDPTGQHGLRHVLRLQRQLARPPGPRLQDHGRRHLDRHQRRPAGHPRDLHRAQRRLDLCRHRHRRLPERRRRHELGLPGQRPAARRGVRPRQEPGQRRHRRLHARTRHVQAGSLGNAIAGALAPPLFSAWPRPLFGG